MRIASGHCTKPIKARATAFCLFLSNISLTYEGAVGQPQGVIKRFRLSWLTNSPRIWVQMWGEGVAGSQPMSTAILRSPNKLWSSNSTFMVSVSHSFFFYVSREKSQPTGEGVGGQNKTTAKKIVGRIPLYVPLKSPPHTNTNQLTMSRVKLTDDVGRHWSLPPLPPLHIMIIHDYIHISLHFPRYFESST